MKKLFIFSFLIFIFLIAPSSLSAKEFSDTNGHWAQNYIQNAADFGLIKGYPDGTFRPDQKISRAEFVTILAQESGESINEASIHAEEFPDVANNHWARRYILWGRENKILTGYDDGTFRPDHTITRQEMASLLYRYITNYRKNEIIENTQRITFSDDYKIGNWAKDSVYAMQRSGIINGRGNNIFDPLTGTTRSETTVMMSKYLQYYRLPTTDVTGADVYFNGELKASNVATIQQNGIIMVPARIVMEAAEYKITYYSQSKLVVANRIDSDLEFWIEKTTYYKNGISGTLKTAPTIVNGTTYIPLSELPFIQTLNTSASSEHGILQIKMGDKSSHVQRGVSNFNGSANSTTNVNGDIFIGNNQNGFLGTLSSGSMHYGTYLTDGCTYIGYWENGIPNGMGRLITADGELFVGTFKNGARLTGTTHFTDGSQFIGTWKKASNSSIYPEKGQYITPDGTKYGSASSEWSTGALTKSKW